MGRRKQHYPKRTTDEPDKDDKTDEDQTINLAARWIQLQAQFALRLQQQSEIAEKKVKPEPETTPQPTRPLDLNNKTGPPNLMSFASLMMDSWSNTSSSSTSSAGMTALQKISHLAQRSLSIPAAASASDRFPPVNHSSSPFSILQMPYGGLKSSSPHHWPPVPAPAAHPSWLMMPRSTIPQSQPPPPLPPVGSALYHRTAPTAEKALTDGDLFRCIWCREAFSTMANLSNHIKEAKHGEKDKNLAVTTSVTTTAAVPHAAGQSKNESNKMHTSTPRKLVRGQDVWLGKGEEQTRQILKCMWCGQSFRSLAELTTHMSETKHYTKVIPQEQLSTWRAQQQQNSPSHSSTPSPALSTQPSPTSIVSDGKDKKVNKKQLSTQLSCQGQAEKRKKAIPVRKLLEMERQNLEAIPTIINDENVSNEANRSTVDSNRSHNATSILGSLERLVETSFKPNAASVDLVVAQQVMMAKRALASSRSSGGGGAAAAPRGADNTGGAGDCGGGNGNDTGSYDDHGHEDKKAKYDNDEDDEWSCRGSPVNPPPTPTIAELKFLKYSELAKELSSSR